jgi:hypothetical protein
MSYTRRMNDHVRLSCEKRFLTKFNKAKQVLLLVSTTQIWILLLPEKEFNEFSGFHLKCNDSVCTTVYSPLSETHYASFPYCKLFNNMKIGNRNTSKIQGEENKGTHANRQKKQSALSPLRRRRRVFCCDSTAAAAAAAASTNNQQPCSTTSSSYQPNAHKKMHERQEEEANDNKGKTKRVDTVPDKGRVVHSGYSPLLKTSGK